jgi:RNA polymerase sigma-70 factor, ECF subfamily
MTTERISLDERDLIERSQRGDTQAFDRLVGEHYVMVYNTAYRMLGSPDLAEDATVEAFARAYRSLDRFRGEATFSTWLYRIVTNVCLDYLRGSAQTTISLDEGWGEEGEQQREVPDESTNPARTALQRRRQEVVHQALQRLSGDHRAVLVLYDLHGFPYEEVSAILGVPVGTVKSRLNRARHALKQELTPHLELFE